MNSGELHDYISDNHSNICGMVALKDGARVYADYWHGFQPEDAMNVMSVTKSVVALLTGIAADKGLIDIKQPVLDFFPDYMPKRGEKTIQNVTIAHLLMMTAPYKYKYEPWSRVCGGDDWTRAALDLLGGRSGLTGEFKYSTLGIQILTGILANASGMKTIDFANKHLFSPLGITEYRNYSEDTAEEHRVFTMSELPRKKVWFADPQDINTAGWGLCMSANDMAKLGQMCLDGGTDIVSSEWINQCVQPRVQLDARFANMAYGYLWWIPDAKKPAYAAIGNSGNVIYVNPEKRMVVAVTATFRPRVFDRVQFIEERIVPLFD